MQSTNKLSYNNGTNVVPPGSVRISASSVHKFFSHTNQWYRETLMGEKSFISSNASVIGTVVHWHSEDFHNNGSVDLEEADRYIDEQAAINPELDADLIKREYPIMGQLLLRHIQEHPSFEVEQFLYQEIHDGIGVGGSCDSLVLTSGTPTYLVKGAEVTKEEYDAASPDTRSRDLSDCQFQIRDWKTTSAKTLPSTIQYGHKLQLLIYAWLYQQKGYNISSINITYITRNQPGTMGKRGKMIGVYPSKVMSITEYVTKFDFDFIDDIIKLIANSVQAFQHYPLFKHIIAQDYRMYEGPITVPTKPSMDDV